MSITKRKLAYIFFDLPYHIRLKIATELNVLETSEESESLDRLKSLNPTELTQIYFRKIVEQHLLIQLYEKIVLIKPEIKDIINPDLLKNL